MTFTPIKHSRDFYKNYISLIINQISQNFK